jgi:hypothetical protein
MIKIIRPGKIYTAICNCCETTMTYEKEDIKQTMIKVNPHLSHKINSYIECPQCKNKIILEGSIL